MRCRFKARRRELHMTPNRADKTDKVTVVIPNWNGMAFLEDCLSSLRRQTMKDFRTIVIDNGSDDGSVDYIREHFPEVCIRAFHRNNGFCKAVNEGIHLAKSPYVILLNNDTVCDERFVEKLYEAVDGREEVFSAASRMMQMDKPDLIDDAGDYYCALGWAFADGRGLPGSKRMKRRQVFAACAGAAIYRRDLLCGLRGFDERHFAYLEDIDIGWRALRAGYVNIYEPDAVVRHAGSASTGSAYNPFKTKLAAANSVYIIRKNMPAWQILLNLPFLAAGFMIKTLFFVRKGLAGEYLKGLAAGFGLSASYDGRYTVKTSFKTLLKIQGSMILSCGRRFLQK